VVKEQLVLGSGVVEEFRYPVLLQVKFLVNDLLYFVEHQMIVERHFCAQVVHLFNHLK
jgi:hypothetical protein